jgi:hypothetical protein
MAGRGSVPAPLVCRRPPPCRICPTCCCHSLHTQQRERGSKGSVNTTGGMQTCIGQSVWPKLPAKHSARSPPKTCTAHAACTARWQQHPPKLVVALIQGAQPGGVDALRRIPGGNVRVQVRGLQRTAVGAVGTAECHWHPAIQWQLAAASLRANCLPSHHSSCVALPSCLASP